MKKSHSYPSLPYEIFNFSEIYSKYKKLEMLKEALGLNEDKEMNEDMILDFVSEHNYNEFYLMEYIINKTIYAPKEVTAQNFLLISLYDKPEEYVKQYKTTKEMYKNEDVFKKFARSIKKDLHLGDRYNCKLFNYQIYEICSKYITKDIALEPINVHLNLHFMQKWIFEQSKLRPELFTDIEKQIIYHLASGYCASELARGDLIKGEKDKNFLNTIIYDILPAKCHVETINQVMATICCHYPNPEKIEPLPLKGIKVFKEILEN